MNDGKFDVGVTVLPELTAQADFRGLPPLIEIKQGWLAEDPLRSVEMVALVVLLAVGIACAVFAL